MTVSYQYEVASSTSGGFTRLLFMWRGSLYKLIYRELLLFWSLFISLSALYRHAFTTVQKRAFEHIVVYCDTFINLIPLSFVLGFYVAYVAGRWWQQYMAIPWPDKVMHLVALYVTGNDEYGRMLRRSLMRYLNLSLILVLRSISSAVKRRFPTLDHVVDSGFMTHLELELFQSVPSLEFNTYWIPCTWFINLLKEARRSHRIPDAQGLKIIMEEFNDFRSKCGLLWSYDWVSIPLVYTQVVTLATYSFFAVALVGRQYIEGTEKSFQMKLDVYLPVFTILQFFFFMGLLKVAEQLINPFGDDDEDFELNWIIDRHTKVSYLGVDILMNRCPPLTKDIFFDAENITLPYTEAAAAYKRKTYRGSVANMTVPEKKQTMFLPDIEEEEEEEKKGNMTPQTSSASLSTFDSENVTHNKRQISGSPEISPRMVRNMSETTIQMDTPEALIEPSEPERYSLSEKMRRLTKCSTPRPEQRTRMPFHAGSKAPQTPLQPWPSATNLMHPNVEDSVPAAGLSKLAKKNPGLRITLQRPSIDEESDEMDFEVPVGETNLSLSQEKEEPEEPKSCDCKSTPSSSEQNRDVCQVQCLHENICQHAEESGEPIFTRPRLHTCPKYFPRRQQLSSSERWKRGSRWKAMFRKKSIKTRRRTVDSVPASSGSTHEKTMVQTKSYPNLPLSEQFVLRDLAEPKATGTTEETGSTSKSKEEVDD